jgi:adenosylmethionine-8-amino-7-oxononanoate aminotransferase
MDRDDIIRRDKAHVWHPYTPMDTYIRDIDPIVAVRAEGAWLEDANGRRYLDGNSSWWVAALGHGHPRLLRAMSEQAAQLAHCSLARTTHPQAALLAEELCAVAPPGLTRVFYSDNGSTSIEVAVKMAVQMWNQTGAPKKTRFVALEGAFHGETIAATSLCGIEVFRRPFAGVVFDTIHVPSPGEAAYAQAFDALARVIRGSSDTLAAVVVEPMVQGASGMRIYDAQYLRELRDLCTKHDVLLVIDEVFAGYGRTGPMWACEHAGITPDILCLGKVFASLIPMAATLASERVFQAFLGDPSRALYYGHTFCGNPIGAALAREVLAIYRDEDVLGQVARKAPRITRTFERLAALPGVQRVRSLGMIGAADLDDPNPGYLGGIGWRVYEEGRVRGAFLRPLGSTVYVAPPLTIPEAELEQLLGILEESVRTALTKGRA